MKKLVQSLAIFLFLFGFTSVASAGGQPSFGEALDLDAGALVVEVDAGITTTYQVTLTNLGSAQDVYDVTMQSYLLWADETGFPKVLTLGALQSTTFTIEITPPEDVELDLRDAITLTATSQDDSDLTIELKIMALLKGERPQVQISAPDTAKTGTGVAFTLTGGDEFAQQIKRYLMYIIDWDNDGKRDLQVPAILTGHTVMHVFDEPGNYKVGATGVNTYSNLQHTGFHTIAITGSASVLWQKRYRGAVASTACKSGSFLTRSLCPEYEGVIYTDRSRRRLEKTTGRRMAALQKRKEDRKSFLIPTSMTIAPKRIDLSPRTYYRGELPKSENITLRYARSLRAPKEGPRSLLHQTGEAVIRGDEGKMPVCTKARGLRLINCLILHGIDITSRTADRYTIKIWERMRKRQDIE